MKTEIDIAIESLKKDFDNVVGWSNKIRNGKIRVYLSKPNSRTADIPRIRVGGQNYEVEFVTIGEISVL